MTPEDARKAVGGYAVARYGCNGGGEHGRGKIVAFSIAPTFTIEKPDGTRFEWRYDLCDVFDKQPKWADLFGIDPAYMEGQPADEWLEEQRGEA